MGAGPALVTSKSKQINSVLDLGGWQIVHLQSLILTGNEKIYSGIKAFINFVQFYIYDT